jgi:BlaI family penicillinase repressor
MRLSQTEWQLMNALWQGHPATAREIAERLPAGVDWAYTTIKTMLTRLVAKRAVSEHKRGNASFYEPLLSREAARGNALSALVDQAFGGAVAPLVHFLVEERRLSRRERQELLDLLRAEPEEGGRGGHDA